MNKDFTSAFNRLFLHVKEHGSISAEDIPLISQIIDSLKQLNNPDNVILFIWALHNSTDASKNSDAWNDILVRQNIEYLQNRKALTGEQLVALKKQLQEDNIFGEYATKSADNLLTSMTPATRTSSLQDFEVANRYHTITKLRLARPITHDRLPDNITAESLSKVISEDNALRVLITSPVNFECAVTEATNYLSADGIVSINLRTIQTETDRQAIRDFFKSEESEGKVEFVDFNTSNAEEFQSVIRKNNIGYDAITTRPRAAMGKELIQAAIDSSLVHPLRFVGCSSVGFDHIDLESATQHKVIVANSPGENSSALARLIITQIEMLFRNVVGYNRDIHAGKWDVDLFNQTEELVGKTLGVIGPGASGALVIQEARKRGMKVIAYGKGKGDSERIARLNGTYGDIEEANSIEELLKKSDVVSVHVPHTEETKDMIGEKEIAMMKKGSFLIVSATRGGVVNEKAASKALASGQLRGAAFDVLETEKDSAEISSPLLDQPSAILTPHIGCITPDAVRRVVDTVSRSIVCLNSGDYRCSVVNPGVLDTIEAPNSLRYDYKNLVGRDLSPPLVPKGTGRSMHLVALRQPDRNAVELLAKILNSKLQTPITTDEIPVALRNSFSQFYHTQSSNWQR